MIKMQVIGNLGKDCVQNEVNGKNVINFNVAHTEKYKDAQGNLVEKTTWVSCSYWTDRTGIAPYLVKGQQIFAEGIPDVEIYTNRENQPAATLRLRVFNIQLLGGRPETSSGSTASASQQSSGTHTSGDYSGGSRVADSSAAEVDDLPF